LTSRLAGDDKKQKSYAFHVVAEDQPIRLFLGHIQCMVWRGEDRRGDSSYSGSIKWGALEARVGDQLWVDCGSYQVSSQDKNPPKPTGVIRIEPFKAERIY
jgi:hypothetical protein